MLIAEFRMLQQFLSLSLFHCVNFFDYFEFLYFILTSFHYIFFLLPEPLISLLQTFN